MSPVAFVDANIPIYAAGGEHVYKEPCAQVLVVASENPNSFVTDAGVLQEMLHRYAAAGQPGSGEQGR